MTTAIDDALAACADPAGAAVRLARFVEAGGRIPDDATGARLLARLLASGGYLPRLLERDPEALARLLADPYLLSDKPAAQLHAECAAAARSAVDFAGLQRALRRYAGGEMLRLGARQLEPGSTLTVARELSHLADAALVQATRWCERAVAEAHGAPVGADQPASFVVLAMGKLGGFELNFSSDVDLIYFYATDDGAAGKLTLHEHYTRVAHLVTRALDENTEDGFVFRVDLRLRPEGRSGPVCNAVAAAERYYETFGRTWERQALLRARPCAGDLALGERLLKLLEPFVFRRSLDPRAVDDVLSLRRLFQVRAGAAGAPAAFDVKQSPGGIRDVELVAQLLQLLHGGQRPELRTRETLAGLQRLFVAGLLTARERQTLSDAYVFLRTLEHHLQLEDAAQTQTVPVAPAARARLARQLGFPDLAALDDAVARTRAGVQAVADTLGEPNGDAAVPAAVLRLIDPARSAESLDDELRACGFADVEGSRRVLESARARLPERWLAEALVSPDPDRALRGFRDLALRGSAGLRALVDHHAQLLRMLASLFGTSDRLSRLLVAQPELWEPLLWGLGVVSPPVEHWDRTIAARLAAHPEDDDEARMRELRHVQTEELLRIGLHDVAGTLEPEEVSRQLTLLAEACVRAQVAIAARGLRARHGVPDAELAVLGLGSVGARELRYGSDLDLVFLFSRTGSTERGTDHQEWFARLAQRMIAQLGAWMPEGRLYEVDTRLRPSGQQGLLVTSYAAFADYHARQAAPWERAALLRGRPLFRGNLARGGQPEGDALPELLARVAYEHDETPEHLRAELARIRARIVQERVVQRQDEGRAPRDAWHLRLSPGGLTDVEFIAAYAQLCFGAARPELRVSSPGLALEVLIERQLLPGLPRELIDDVRWLRRLGLRIRLLRDDRDCEEWLPHAGNPVLARTLGVDDATLLARTRQALQRLHTAYRAVFEQPGAPRLLGDGSP